MRKIASLAPLGAGLLILIGLVAALLAAGGAGASHAGGMDAMSIDMDVAGNTATSLGPRDDCVVAAPGAVLTLDVTAEGIPASNPLVGFAFDLNYVFGAVSVDHADAAYMLVSEPGSEMFNISDPVPDSDGSWSSAVADFSDWVAVPPEYGAGVLVRLKVRVFAEASPGLYILFLTAADHIDAQNLSNIPDVINYAYVAVNSGCDDLPVATPTPAPTPLATPLPPGPTPPLASMERMSIDMVTAGNGATNLGPREDCRTATPGGVITMDITATNVPPSNPMLGFTFLLTYPAGYVSVLGADASFLLASEVGSSLLDALNEPTPDSDGAWLAQVGDFSDWRVIPPESGSGILARIEVSIADSAGEGLYDLRLSEAAHIDLLNRGAPPAAIDGAVLAVGIPCPANAATSPSQAAPAGVSPTPTALGAAQAPAALPPTGGSAGGAQVPAAALAALAAIAVASVAFGVRLRRRT